MRFFLEWTLAIHRAIWFPFNWFLGLDRPGVEVPMEVGIEAAAGTAPAVAEASAQDYSLNGCDRPARRNGSRTRAARS